MLSIVTYNTGHGNFNSDYIKGNKPNNKTVKSNIEGQIKLLKEIDADIILTQENGKLIIDQHQINQFKMYRKGLDKYQAKYYSNNNIINLVDFGNATFTKQSAKYQTFNTPYKIKGLIKNIRRINKGVLITELSIDNKKLVIFNIHTVAYKENYKIREKQFAYIFERAIAEFLKGNYVIVGGDFNHEFHKDKSILDTYEMLGWNKAIPKEGTIRSNKEKYTKKTPTFTIDGFIVSKNIEVIKVESLNNFKYSDHSPVLMHFKLK
ncbi:MAG: hypothetical protein GX864_01980 [Mollicutes bacterium]|jgi:endonuclease/exonuclease/phosphatase family metal-dependent hydrolase|nr:hypothetical protein [Mollicutes bacterium]